MHNCDFGVGGGALAIGFAGAQSAVEIAATAVSAEDRFVLFDAVFLAANYWGGILLHIHRPQPAQVLLVLDYFCCCGSGVMAADFGDGEDWLPALEPFGASLGRRVAKASAGEGTLCPAVVDAGHMPVYFVGGCVAVELVANIDQILDGGYVDVVDGRKVQNDGLQSRLVDFGWRYRTTTRAGIIPRAILEVGVSIVISEHARERGNSIPQDGRSSQDLCVESL